MGVGPAEWRQTLEAQLERLHDSMLSLIAALDAMDGDTDLEPWLAGTSWESQDREGCDPLDEGEPNDWDDEDSGDDEPSLGSSNPDPSGIPIGWSYNVFGADGDND